MIVNILILLILLACVILGVRNGFIREMSLILGTIIGFWIASQKYFVLEHPFARLFNNQMMGRVFSFVLIFILFFTIIVLLGYFLSKVINLVLLGWLDRLLGGVLGLASGLIIIWLVLLFLATFVTGKERRLWNSRLSLRILEIGSKVSGLQIDIRPPKIKRKVLTFAPKSIRLEVKMNHNHLTLGSIYRDWEVAPTLWESRSMRDNPDISPVTSSRPFGARLRSGFGNRSHILFNYYKFANLTFPSNSEGTIIKKKEV